MRTLNRFLATAAFSAGFVLSAATAQADSLTAGLGWFNFDSNDHHNSSSFVGGEWRGNPFYYGFEPTIGALVNTDGGVYGYAGIDYDWEFAPKWFLTPGIDLGGYAHGSGIDLGGAFEFREQVELTYLLDNQMRVGAQFSHISNADIYNNNPGEESLMAVITIPLGNR